jgi:hypothetical protein
MASRPRGFYKEDGVTHPIMGRGSGRRSHALNLTKPSPTSFTASEKKQAQRDRHDENELASEIKRVTTYEIDGVVRVHHETDNIQAVEIDLTDNFYDKDGISGLNLKNVLNALDRHGYEITRIAPFGRGITIKGERRVQ